MKRISAFILILFLLMLSSACGKSDEELKDMLAPDDVKVQAPEKKLEPELKEGKPNSEALTASELQAKEQEAIYDDAKGAINVEDAQSGGQPSKAVGYIYIPGTDIKDWIMWAKDNNYFHRKDNSEQYSFAGCYYLDQECRLKPLSRNVVIYGHNMNDDRDGVKFGQLVRYQEIDFINENQNIFIQTPDGTRTYKIVAAFFSDIHLNYIQAKPSTELRKELVEEYKLRSEFVSDIPVDENDRFITLSTCTYKYGNREDQRWVIIGRLMREGETADTAYSFTKNENPKAPEFDKEVERNDIVEAKTSNYDNTKEVVEATTP